MHMKTLFKNARILKMNGEPIIQTSLLVEENRIKYIGDSYEEFAPFDRVIECNGNLIMPGFKNSHAHNAMTFIRSYADDLPLKEWLFDKVFPLEDKLTPEDVYYFTKLGILECLSSGITANFDYYFHYSGMFKATEEMGIRTVILLTPSLPEEELAEYHINYSDKNKLITTMFGLHAEYTLQDGWLDMINRLVHRFKVPFYTHCSETEKEKNECLERRGIAPFKFFFEKGLFDYGGGIYHGVSLTDEEIKLIKDNNLFVVTNPGSNTKLASGICDTVKLNNLGVNIAIGTDGPASNNCLDMFKEMFLVTGLAKLFNMDPSAMDAIEVLKMATVNGAKAMGLNDADTLEVGKFADIIMIDLNKPNMRPIHSIEKNLVYAGSKDNIMLTMVNGKVLYEDGKYYVGEPVEDIYEKCQLLAEKLANSDKN